MVPSVLLVFTVLYVNTFNDGFWFEYSEIIVAICELSLMHYHSGFEFFMLVSHLAKEGIHFKNLEEFYN
jgi:hypothetical protein